MYHSLEIALLIDVECLAYTLSEENGFARKKSKTWSLICFSNKLSERKISSTSTTFQRIPVDDHSKADYSGETVY